MMYRNRLEHFQWLTDAQSSDTPALDKQTVSEALADVLLYLVCLADQLGVDLLDAATHKMEKNALKYPADQVHGKSKKYSDD